MAVMIACAALLAAGVVMALRPAGRSDEDASPRPTLRRLLAASLGAGLVAGVLVAGAGGRLAMRLLAATSPEVEAASPRPARRSAT